MKELESYNKDTAGIVKQVIKNKQKLASFRLPKGCKLWRLELATGEITEAVVDIKNLLGHSRIETQPGKYLFDVALNRANAEKKFQSQIIKLLKHG